MYRRHVQSGAGRRYSTAVSGSSGLVGYWQFGETSGDYADSSSQGNVGVVNGGVIQGVAGPRPTDGFQGFNLDNTAAGFDSSDGGDYISVADPANDALDPRLGDLTYSLWFKGPSDGGDYMLLSKASGSRDGYYFERLDSAEGSFSNKLNTVIDYNPSLGAIGPIGPVSDPNHWTNAVFVLHRNRTSASTDYTASGASLFINGVFFGNDLSTAFDGFDMNNALPLVIGAFREEALNNYTGTIDDVSIFNRSLSPTEISDLYHIAVFGVAPSQWNVTSSGNWTDSANWSGVVPNAVGETASFRSTITSSQVITVNAPITVGNIDFDNANKYTIAGSSTLTLDNSSGLVTVTVASGSHDILAPLALAQNATFAVTLPGSTLTVGNLQPSTVAITKQGAGTLLLNNVRAGTLAVSTGVVAIQAGRSTSHTSVVGRLKVTTARRSI